MLLLCTFRILVTEMIGSKFHNMLINSVLLTLPYYIVTSLNENQGYISFELVTLLLKRFPLRQDKLKCI